MAIYYGNEIKIIAITTLIGLAFVILSLFFPIVDITMETTNVGTAEPKIDQRTMHGYDFITAGGIEDYGWIMLVLFILVAVLFAIGLLLIFVRPREAIGIFTILTAGTVAPYIIHIFLADGLGPVIFEGLNMQVDVLYGLIFLVIGCGVLIASSAYSYSVS